MEKQEKEAPKYEMEIELIQPWSVPVMKTTLPPKVLQTMIEISDLIVTDKEAENFGDNLVGQIETELKVEQKLLEQTGVMDFFINAIRQFVIICKCQSSPKDMKTIQQEEWAVNMSSMWIVSQQPNEYNPVHFHTNCSVSAVMYLKIPKMLPSRKTNSNRPASQQVFSGHSYNDLIDGSIVFISNASRDLDFSIPNINYLPAVGDFFMFGAQQNHQVYPYRCAEGQKETERRSISFNAAYQTKAERDNIEQVKDKISSEWQMINDKR